MTRRVRRTLSVTPPDRPDRARVLRGARARLLTYRSVARLLADWDANLSRGRLFLSTAHPARVGAPVRVRLVLLVPPAEVCLEGRVVDVTPWGNGLNDCPGVTVACEPGAGTEALAALVRELRSASDVPSPTAPVQLRA